MSNLFDSIFNNATATVDPLRLLLALLVSLFLGMALSWTYKYRTLYTREFVIKLIMACEVATRRNLWPIPSSSFDFTSRNTGLSA